MGPNHRHLWHRGSGTGRHLGLFRVIRTVVGILFMLCVTFLVLKVCFDIDITPWLQPLLKQVTAL